MYKRIYINSQKKNEQLEKQLENKENLLENCLQEKAELSQNLLNTHDDIQVAIFEIEELENSYILGWEDLDLNGGTGGDRDYQDMIVRITIAQVPEPGSMALLGLGLLGLVATRKKAKVA